MVRVPNPVQPSWSRAATNTTPVGEGLRMWDKRQRGYRAKGYRIGTTE